METLENFLKNQIGILTKDEFEKLTTFPYYPRTIEDITEILHTTNNEEGIVYKPRCMMTNTVSPPPHYMADKSLTTGDKVSYPDINGISMTIGKSFAKVSVAIPEGACPTLSDVEYRIVNDPVHMYMLPNIFKGQVHTPHYDKDPGSDFNTYFTEYFNPKSHILYEFKEDELGEYDNTTNDNTAPLYKCNFTWRKANTSTTATKKHTLTVWRTVMPFLYRVILPWFL
ncbi:MAG: hypothetical protein LUE93_11685 [Bacteroides sp.]|nr:hypothetical protein [Bacteroides sp.]